jgi:hypothetical protein
MWFTRPESVGRLVLTLVVFLLMTLFGMRLAILRCHDCDKSGWWSLFLWLPTVNVIATLVLAFAPGTDGSNQYGEKPPHPGWLPFFIALGSMLLLLGLTFNSALRSFERITDEMKADEDTQMIFQADPRAASLPTADQRAAFNDRYLGAGGQKAFAISPAGGWGYVERRSSVNEAVRGAMQECEARRPAYTQPCVVVNVNGRWAGEREQ